MEILLVLINCSLLIFTFFFLGRWLIRLFNKKYLYIYMILIQISESEYIKLKKFLNLF